MSYLGALSAALALLSSCGAATYTASPPRPVAPVRTGPPHQVSLRPGQRRTFAPGVLRARDVVSCTLSGRTVKLRIPNHPPGSWAESKEVAVPSGGGAGLEITSASDGSITASCGKTS